MEAETDENQTIFLFVLLSSFLDLHWNEMLLSSPILLPLTVQK